jgi:hypothetical protein
VTFTSSTFIDWGSRLDIVFHRSYCEVVAISCQILQFLKCCWSWGRKQHILNSRNFYGFKFQHICQFSRSRWIVAICLWLGQ